MELNSIEDVKALNEYQTVKQIERIEKKIHRLSFVPATSCAFLIAWAVWCTWTAVAWSPIHIILIAISIATVGHANVQRTDLIRRLFELKYGK
ncbi:hypothetical protein [Arsukibacterium sp.]|uniref:hypothetical protein n=1 Tax=Arsukibacterium sp. TaxID=1977258 RepID=UPI001BD53331|nr:hypothetical protein [Arsukibacterium sp.]